MFGTHHGVINSCFRPSHAADEDKALCFPSPPPPNQLQSKLRGSKRARIKRWHSGKSTSVRLDAPWRRTSCEYSDFTLRDSVWEITTHHAVDMLDGWAEAAALQMVCFTATTHPHCSPAVTHTETGFILFVLKSWSLEIHLALYEESYHKIKKMEVGFQMRSNFIINTTLGN